MKKNIAVVFGGYSSEFEVSVKSGKQIISCLDTDKYNVYPVLITEEKWVFQPVDSDEIMINKEDFSFELNGNKVFIDCAVITIHGTPGENGILQAYFELLNIPYSTCDVAASALTFDKFRCNKFLKNFGINVADSLLIRKGDNIPVEYVNEKIGYPCFVKPNGSGSSCGVSKVKSDEDLLPAVENAMKESNYVIVESFVEGTEVTCGILKTKNSEYILPITELETENEFFDYEAKYTDGKTNEITPARISEENKLRCNELTSKIYDLIGCRGVVRVDFIIQDDVPFLIEINTTPGMSKNSIIPQQVDAYGMKLGDFFNEIINDVLIKGR